MTRVEKESNNEEDAKNAGDGSSNNKSEVDVENEENPLEIDTSTEKNESNKNEENSPRGSLKRPSDQSDSSSSSAKKMRTKPKPQIIENMKDYVDKNNLDKLTTATLMHWLKSKSLRCTTRDKKAVLMEKVNKYFSEETENTK